MRKRKSVTRTQQFCQGIKTQIEDENMAVTEYNAKAAESRKLDNPSAEILAVLFEKIATDEASHADALRKVAKEVCPI